MKHAGRHVTPAAIIAVVAITATAVCADDTHRYRYGVNSFVSDMPIKGRNLTIDPVLQNPWGFAFSPAGPFWIADNATGCSTLYDGNGTNVRLKVSIPLPGNVVPPTSCKTVDVNNPPKNAAPTGIIWNPFSAFVVPGTTIQAAIILATEDGTLSAWAGGDR
jgi:hypothetical protein